MTPQERLDDLEQWLLKEYNATLERWAHTHEPTMRALMFAKLQTLAAVAEHLAMSPFSAHMMHTQEGENENT